MTRLFDDKVPGRVILEGVGGSISHGLNNENSDVDTVGVYIAPIQDVMGMEGISAVKNSVVTTSPDATFHEVGKFCNLAIKGNPSILEQLWIDHYYRHLTGAMLIARRKKFLGSLKIRSAYLGYAHQQVERIGRHPKNSETEDKVKKLAKHAIRLTIQGRELLETGDLPLNLSDRKEEILCQADFSVSNWFKFHEFMEKQMNKLETQKASIPEHPDMEYINGTLIQIRKFELQVEEK